MHINVIVSINSSLSRSITINMTDLMGICIRLSSISTCRTSVSGVSSRQLRGGCSVGRGDGISSTVYKATNIVKCRMAINR